MKRSINGESHFAGIPKSETPTLPEMRAVRIGEVRTEIVGLNINERNQEICSLICALENIDPIKLRCRRMTEGNKSLIFAEYYNEDTGISYVYIEKDISNPDQSRSRASVTAMHRSGSAVLLRVSKDGNRTIVR